MRYAFKVVLARPTISLILLCFCHFAEAQTITWSGRTWKVTSGGMAGVARGDAKNVSIDDKGYLHLEITQRDGKWTAAKPASLSAADWESVKEDAYKHGYFDVATGIGDALAKIKDPLVTARAQLGRDGKKTYADPQGEEAKAARKIILDALKTLGEARAVILEQLSNRYKRPFVDVWEFVEWAEKNKLGLDFTSPPKRNPLALGVKTP